MGHRRRWQFDFPPHLSSLCRFSYISSHQAFHLAHRVHGTNLAVVGTFDSQHCSCSLISDAASISGESGTFSIGSNYHAPPKALATTNAPTSSVATALLRASHKEAQKGLANDLLSILERDAKPWGFSYADVRQKVKVWYGDKDEKIGEGGIRWMERVMQDCEVTICKGRDHSLMTCAPVVVEALESLQEELRRGMSY